ncbi:hypothetical protein FGG08_006055 [Glutinoglossum americanum]|uniref:Uncharacterized protein n=1 Tax=Glutinoglossum americanum TaxID=1670608 RepID=A0A9P8I616_9PEZI|nr:hypothetical protein FGG08_006055 [Glutinoglossum americanum]
MQVAGIDPINFESSPELREGGGKLAVSGNLTVKYVTEDVEGIEDVEGGEDDCSFETPDASSASPNETIKASMTSTTVTPRRCTCSISVVEALSGLQDNSDDKKGIRLLKLAFKARLDLMCRRHLRTLSSRSVGLHNNHPNLVLKDRISKVVRHASNLAVFKVKHHDWFYRSKRPAVNADRLTVYRYAPVALPEFTFDAVRTFERFAGAGSWQIWQRDGTIVIGGVFNYLRQPSVMNSIDVEFAIYKHHHRNLSGRSRLGWLRNMFYSLIQQLVRQDPVWYAIIASARPDKNWRLITYPYITKDTDTGGETTGFLHLDLNTSKFVQDGSGGNLLSSSMSLDDEEADGCTVVVPGFHRHIKEWHARRLRRGEDPASFTTNCSASYRAEDRRDWGEPEPAPCPAFGIRITQPEIIHGSTPFSNRRRSTLNPWYSGILENHEDLEIHGTLSWSELAACHRDLEAPGRELSGQTPRYGLPGFRFPGSIIMEGSSALGDTLVSRGKWTDPQATKEKDILLGDDDERARVYVAAVREKMVARYKEAYSQLEEMERKFFGEHSYFYCQEHGLETDGKDAEGLYGTDDEGDMNVGNDSDDEGRENGKEGDGN